VGLTQRISASPPLAGWQSEVGVGIFSKKGSDFIQKRQHCTIFSVFYSVLRLAALRLGADRGQISEIIFACGEKIVD
jgi:hypothetical protein